MSDRRASMDFERRVRALFDEALAVPVAERGAFLAGAAAGEERLLTEVEELLSLEPESTGFLEEPVFRVADSSLAEDFPVDEDPPLAPDERVGPYRVLRLLGEGGMGAVYAAEQERPIARHVALKVIRRGMDTRRVVARFEAERNVLARFDHPGIARILDAGSTADGRPFFAMELVDGVRITDWCDGERASIRSRVSLMRQVCAAVQHAHQNGVVHRDLKPSNVLVSRAAGETDATIKVIDFGIAKATLGDDAEGEALTRAGSALGTPAYMAPESLTDGVSSADTRADVYSLAVLLHELLTGERPERDGEGFVKAPSACVKRRGEGETAEALAALRRTKASRLRQTLRGDLDAILLQALAPDRDDRYPSVSEFAADLGRYLADVPVHAGSPGRFVPLLRFLRRHRWAASFVALTSLGTVAALVMAIVALGRARAALEREEDARRLSDQRLVEIERRVDLQRLAELALLAEDLWPSSPDQASKMRSFLNEVDELLARQRSAESWIAKHGSDSQARLAMELQRWSKEEGPRMRVAERLAFLERLDRRSLEEAASAWDTAIEAIADPDQTPLYGGLSMQPQFGLVPLGPDPESGLWEFAHLASGVPPERGGDGYLSLGDESAIVFVLLPRGDAWVGATTPAGASLGEVDPGVPLDPRARQDESPPTRVSLEPFFLSKFEMTQGQWERLTGTNPSDPRAGLYVGTEPITLRHPVCMVSWEEARLWTQRFGITLPTEAQWEYAARARTTSVFWSGDEPDALTGVANVAGLETLDMLEDNTTLGGHRDDHESMAPVGSYWANPFGLHDVHGNVWELCLDPWLTYDAPARPGDGLRLGDSERRLGRGGGYASGWTEARSANRQSTPPDAKASVVGLRPARALD